MLRRLALVLVIVTGATATLAAEPSPPSNIGIISNGIFREAQDQYLSVLYSQELEKNAVFLQFEMPTNGLLTSAFQIGTAIVLEGLRLGARYQGSHIGSDGLLTGGNVEADDVDLDAITDGTGQIVAMQSTTSNESDYQVNSDDTVDVLIGLGPIGIGNTITFSDDYDGGNFYSTYAFPGGASWNTPSVDTNAQTATSVEVREPDGTLVSSTMQDYRNGNDRSNAGFTDTVSFGITLDLGEVQLAPYAMVDVGSIVNDNTATFESYARNVGAGYPAFTAPTMAGEDTILGTATEDITSYNVYNAADLSSRFDLNPMIGAEITATNFAGVEAMTVVGRIAYGAELPLYSASYTPATGGEATTVAGTASTYEGYAYTATTYGPDLVETEATVTRAVETQTISQFNQEILPTMKLLVTPSNLLQIGISYHPEIAFQSDSRTTSGTAVQTVTTDDGIAGDSPDDRVVETTITYAGSSWTRSRFTFRNYFDAAASFYIIPDRLRLNLGSQVSNLWVDEIKTEESTPGVTTRVERTATGTTSPEADDFVTTNTSVNTDVRDASDNSLEVYDSGFQYIDYDFGLTFFFDKNMFLDLNMDAVGNIWDLSSWSLEMTILY